MRLRECGSIVLALVGFLPLLASCGGAVTAHQTLLDTTVPLNTVLIQHGEFHPFITVVVPGTEVTWHNQDALNHKISATFERRAYLNQTPLQATIAPHGISSVRFDKPGLYHYYDPTVSDWSAEFARVLPRQGAPNFPMTMEGMILVKGPQPDLPNSATNSIVPQHDRIATNIVAIRTGGTVSWHNYDTDAHFLLPVLGWDSPVNPIDIGISNFLGSTAHPPDGETRTFTFTVAGLYYYYCLTHAKIEPQMLRAMAHQDASEYPVPMEGWVLVADGA